MLVRWTEQAASDLEHITDYLFEQAPERAAELVRMVYDSPAGLVTYPNAAGLARKTERASWWCLRCPTSSFTRCAVM
jgi:plasmid stabilization system protein ParE